MKLQVDNLTEDNLNPYQKIFFIITRPEFLVLLTITYNEIVILFKNNNKSIYYFEITTYCRRTVSQKNIGFKIQQTYKNASEGRGQVNDNTDFFFSFFLHLLKVSMETEIEAFFMITLLLLILSQVPDNKTGCSKAGSKAG